MAILCRALGGSTSTASSVGDVLFAGGAGGAAVVGAGFGGGGGSSGGPGGNGGTSAPTNGVAGFAPGGGAGGGGSNGTTGGSAAQNGGNGQVVISGTTFSTPGAFTYTVGVGVTSVVIECWGGGDLTSAGGPNSGAGGLGGVYAKKTAAVTPGQKLMVSVGRGGILGSGSGVPSLVYTYPPFSFLNAEGWVFNAGGGTGLTGVAGATGNIGADPNDPVFTSGYLNVARSGKLLSNGTPYWEWSGTWEDLGAPAGSTITAVNVTYDWYCENYTTGAASTVGPAELYNSAGTLRNTFSTSQAVSAVSTQWATKTGTTQSGLSDASNTSIRLRINAKPNTGSSNSALVTLDLDYVQIAITYTGGGGGGVVR
jgi:hypothetical protein